MNIRQFIIPISPYIGTFVSLLSIISIGPLTLVYKITIKAQVTEFKKKICLYLISLIIYSLETAIINKKIYNRGGESGTIIT